ncbi:capsid protein [Human associated cyclovirus 7]|uniref:Capsid protein n=1 Tax=Human associated cyclovirus 7 TaxID=2038725 RepID=D4N3Q9_9CIRC|nr:capsid protein [Cyclovirus NG14]ADD62474.1 capsid protein [Cyclovirus NG14]
MPAVRRSRVRRRKPVYRRRRYRRRYRRKRGTTKGFKVKLTETQLVQANVTKNELKELHIDLANFTEFNRLQDSFEYFVPRLVVHTIIPQQNVSNTSTSAVPPYCMFPYHKNIPSTGVGWTDYLSVDKAKLYRGTQVGRMAFVPSIGMLNNVEINCVGSDCKLNKFYRQDIFRPKLRCPDSNAPEASQLPRLFCGGVCFAGNSFLKESDKSYFMIKTDVYLTLYNQNTLEH